MNTRESRGRGAFDFAWLMGVLTAAGAGVLSGQAQALPLPTHALGVVGALAVPEARQVMAQAPAEAPAPPRTPVSAPVPAPALASSPTPGPATSLASGPAPATATAPVQSVNALGVVGGLAIPEARMLGNGTVAVGLGNAREPQVGPAQKPRSVLLGVGLLPGLEVVGRVAEYGERDATGFTVRTPHDLSMNVKLGFSLGEGPGALRVAAGLNDLGGGAAWFRARYAVATLPVERLLPFGLPLGLGGPGAVTLGVGSSSARIRVPGANGVLDGVFGGVSAQLLQRPGWGAMTAHAEYDGRQPLAGLRFTSVPVAALGQASFNASLMQTAARGPMPAAFSWGLGVSMPFGANERALPRWQPPDASAQDDAVGPGPMAPLARLKARLVVLGMESVRVGRLADGGWAVQFQNRRFAVNEVDAIGVVAGVAARMAPEGVRSLVLVALKQGQPVLTLRTEAPAWRAFLQSGLSAALQDATRVQRGGALREAAVDWLNDEPSAATRVQVQLLPELNYAVATEYGAFDYSLAGRMRFTAPLPVLAPGTQLVATFQGRLASTPNARPGGAFPTLQHEEGLQTLAVHHTRWLGRRAVLGAAVGRFEYGSFGAEGEAVVFVPGRDDVVLLRGRLLDRTATMPRGFDQAGSAVYRWVGTPNLWAELGWHRYTDGSAGPAFSVVRWWSDVAVGLNYRRGGTHQYAGLSMSFPLTPRDGLYDNPSLSVQADPSFRQGLRTRIRSESNFVSPRGVREMELAWDLDGQALNGGRLGPEYVKAQLARMRQAYFLFGVAPRR